MIPCPDFMELEDEMDLGLTPIMLRVPRATAEARLGRELLDRSDFKAWIDANRADLLQIAFLLTLQKPVLAPGEDRTKVILPQDFALL